MLQTDPIRLSSHKGEVLRRVNMWGNRTKRDKPSTDKYADWDVEADTIKAAALAGSCLANYMTNG